MNKPYTYLIKFKLTGQVYYGSRYKNVELNLAPKDDLMITYFTSSRHVRKLIKEHGTNAFEWMVRKIFDTKEQAAAWETKVLRRCKVLENDKWLNRNIAGCILHTPEIRQKISAFHKGKPKSQEHKDKIRNSMLGKNIGRTQTEEHRRKNSEAKRGMNNPMYGKPCSDERRQKISEANRGKSRSEEFKKFTENRRFN